MCNEWLNRIFAIALSAFLIGSEVATAETLVSASFSSYSDGALVGQNGWQQLGAVNLNPLNVSSGAVTWTGGKTVDSQDAILAFPQQVTQPLSGTQILNFDLLLSVASAGGNPAYFAALNTLTTTATSNNFANSRLVARASGSGFQFGARVNGQGGYPFAYGSSVLDFGVDYALRAEIHMVAGNANDFINLYVGPDFNNLTLYATASYASGTVSDPSFGAMVISQFGSGSVNESGVSIKSMSVTAVPEPGSAAIVALAGFSGMAFRRRRS
jgi:hypothetical protein